MKKSAVLLASVLFASGVFARDFNFTINKLTDLDDACTGSFSQQVGIDIVTDPQTIVLSGNYNLVTEIGSYSVMNYQNTTTIPLYPMGLKGKEAFNSDLNSTNGGLVNITINNHHYLLEQVIFDADNYNEAAWGDDPKTLVGFDLIDPNDATNSCLVANQSI